MSEIKPVDKIVMYLVNGAVQGSSIPIPKTTKMKARRVLEKAGFLIREDGMWRLSGKGYRYARLALGAVPMYTDDSPPDTHLTEAKARQQKI
jgi:hypothetical protein